MTDHDARVAYALREEYAGTVLQRETEDDPGTEVPVFSGGLIRAGERDLDLAELLEEGDGTIVVAEDADPLAVAVLDTVPALKRVAVPEGAVAGVGYRDLVVAELRDRATNRGMTGASSANKPTLVNALETDDARIAAGLDTPADYSVAALGANDVLTDLGQAPDGAGDPATPEA